MRPPVIPELAALLRPELGELAAYVPRHPPGIRVRLDANEAPAMLSPRLSELAREAFASVPLERYPDPRASALREALAARTGAHADELLVGCGSDELIAHLCTALARPRPGAPQAVVVTPTPTFVMYGITARAHGLRHVPVPLDAKWDLDGAAMVKAVELARPNVVFVASPNNPTGTRMGEAPLRALLSAQPTALVVVDEAYVDFADGPSLRSWRKEHKNLAILRTLSKVGLAALRVGWLEADAGLIHEIDKVRQPFNLSATSQAMATAIVQGGWGEVEAMVRRVRAERARLEGMLRALPGVEVTPSQANFVWAEVSRPAGEVYEGLAERGVLVRSFHGSGGRLARRLRITVGLPEDSDAVVAALAEVLR
jgi:histidinol-phosphate aminotransferase